MIYNFKKQLAKGQEAERYLDRLFHARGWKIEEASAPEQRQGIDRWFSVNKIPEPVTVEYKTDFRAHETGNVYLETVSVGKYVDGDFEIQKRGWLWTAEADYLMYYIPGDSRVLLFLPADLRDFVVEHEGEYRSVSVKNSGYQGRGLLVPVGDLLTVAKRDWKIGVDDTLQV